MKLHILILMLLVSGVSRAETLTLLCTGEGETEHGQTDGSLPKSDPLYFISMRDPNTLRFLLTIDTIRGNFFTKILGDLDDGSDAAINHPFESEKKFQITPQTFSNVGEYVGNSEGEWYKHRHTNSLDRLTGILVSHYVKTESKSKKIYFSHSTYSCEKATQKF
jgi:hypothetical protein